MHQLCASIYTSAWQFTQIHRWHCDQDRGPGPSCTSGWSSMYTSAWQFTQIHKWHCDQERGRGPSCTSHWSPMYIERMHDSILYTLNIWMWIWSGAGAKTVMHVMQQPMISNYTERMHDNIYTTCKYMDVNMIRSGGQDRHAPANDLQVHECMTVYTNS